MNFRKKPKMLVPISMEKKLMEIEFLLKLLTEEETNAFDVVSKGTGLVIVAKVEDLEEEADEAISEIVVLASEIGADHREDATVALPGVADIHQEVQAEAEVEAGAQVTAEARVQEEIDEDHQMVDETMTGVQAQVRSEMQSQIETIIRSQKKRKVQPEVEFFFRT